TSSLPTHTGQLCPLEPAARSDPKFYGWAQNPSRLSADRPHCLDFSICTHFPPSSSASCSPSPAQPRICLIRQPPPFTVHGSQLTNTTVLTRHCVYTIPAFSPRLSSPQGYHLTTTSSLAPSVILGHCSSVVPPSTTPARLRTLSPPREFLSFLLRPAHIALAASRSRQHLPTRKAYTSHRIPPSAIRIRAYRYKSHTHTPRTRHSVDR
ncbi:hypothetical protein QBC45DRAFT_475606, partial [Copromyces sp. CBS 386.78]